MRLRAILLVFILGLTGCSTLVQAPQPITSFCDLTDFSLSEPAANYSVTYLRKPDPQLGDLSYWNLCGPAWTRGGATLVYSPAELDLVFQKIEQDLNGPKP